MILAALEFVLSPIIWVMHLTLDVLWSLTGSAGTAIVLLSCLVALISYPLRGWAGKIEARISFKKSIIDKKIAVHASGLKGEDHFRVVEGIYKKELYHPIQITLLGLSFLVMLPFLLSALFLLSDNRDLVDVSYLS